MSSQQYTQISIDYIPPSSLPLPPVESHLPSTLDQIEPNNMVMHDQLKSALCALLKVSYFLKLRVLMIMDLRKALSS